MNIISELERDLLDFNYTNKHGGKNSMNVQCVDDFITLDELDCILKQQLAMSPEARYPHRKNKGEESGIPVILDTLEVIAIPHADFICQLDESKPGNYRGTQQGCRKDEAGRQNCRAAIRRGNVKNIIISSRGCIMRSQTSQPKLWR